MKASTDVDGITAEIHGSCCSMDFDYNYMEASVSKLPSVFIKMPGASTSASIYFHLTSIQLGSLLEIKLACGSQMEVEWKADGNSSLTSIQLGSLLK